MASFAMPTNNMRSPVMGFRAPMPPTASPMSPAGQPGMPAAGMGMQPPAQLPQNVLMQRAGMPTPMGPTNTMMRPVGMAPPGAMPPMPAPGMGQPGMPPGQFQDPRMQPQNAFAQRGMAAY